MTTTISINIYEETMNFTSGSWTQEEISYMKNSDHAAIFYGSEDQKLKVQWYLGNKNDAMWIASDEDTAVFFTNEEISSEELDDIDFMIGIKSYDIFTGVSGTYTQIDFDEE